MKNLNLDQLQTFLSAVELGTLTAAAKRRGISQPAASLQVRQLEKRIGVRLIEKVGKKISPTQAGLRMIEHAGKINAAVSSAIDDMTAHADDAAGRIRIGTGATACIYLLPPLLRQLRNEFPLMEISVRTGNTTEILKAVEDNTLDLGFVTLPASGRMFDVTPVLEDEFVLVGSPDIFELPEEATPEALSAMPLVLYEAGGNTRGIVDDWFNQAAVLPKPVMDLGSVEAIKEMVGVGLGCAILPVSAIRQQGERMKFTIRPLSPTLSRHLALVVRHDKLRTKGLREAMRTIATLGM